MAGRSLRPPQVLSAASQARVLAAASVSARVNIGVLGPAASDLQLGHRVWLTLHIMVGPADTVLDVKRNIAANKSVGQLLRTRGRTPDGMRMLRAGGEPLSNEQVLQVRAVPPVAANPAHPAHPPVPPAPPPSDATAAAQTCLRSDGKSELLWPTQEQTDLTRVHPGTFPSPAYSHTFPDRLAPSASSYSIERHARTQAQCSPQRGLGV